MSSFCPWTKSNLVPVNIKHTHSKQTSTLCSSISASLTSDSQIYLTGESWCFHWGKNRQQSSFRCSHFVNEDLAISCTQSASLLKDSLFPQIAINMSGSAELMWQVAEDIHLYELYCLWPQMAKTYNEINTEYWMNCQNAAGYICQHQLEAFMML